MANSGFQDFLSDVGTSFGMGPVENTNYYAEAARRLYDPAREAAVSGIAASKGEAEQQARQRGQIQGIAGPLAEENIQRNARLVGEAGGRNLNALDEQARQAAYTAAEKDRQEYLSKLAAQQQAVFDSFKMGAGLLTGGLPKIGEWLGSLGKGGGGDELDLSGFDWANAIDNEIPLYKNLKLGVDTTMPKIEF